MKCLLVSVFLLFRCASSLFLTMDDMLQRKGPEIDRNANPPKGYIVIVDMRKMCIESACPGITFRASRPEGHVVAMWLANWESIPGVVEYKITKEHYPRYYMSVVGGGCEHNELNCSD